MWAKTAQDIEQMLSWAKQGVESTSLTGMRPMTHCEASYEPLHRSLGKFSGCGRQAKQSVSVH